MNSNEPIGGYFGLELSAVSGFLHDDALLLSSGRTCLEVLLSTIKPQRVRIPKFTCDVILEPLEKLNIPYDFYAIDEQLEIRELPDLADGEVLVYTNYFGIKDEYAQTLAERYGSRLIIDNAQAVYAEPIRDAHTIYSPRKFFGLPDGGMLYTPLQISSDAYEQDTSWERSTHLLKRIDVGPEAGYEDFKRDDADLSNQPVRTMSSLTKQLLKNIDFKAAQEKRSANYTLLNQALGDRNGLAVPEQPTGPMVYPLRASGQLRQKLIDAKVYVATYWPNVLEWAVPDELEYALTESIIPLPIDQRYGAEDMKRILEVINE